MKIKLVLKGGPGSGNFNHAGRPGKVGGSASGFAGTLEVVSNDISIIHKTNGANVKLRGSNAFEQFNKSCKDLPAKAVDIIQNSKHNITFIVSSKPLVGEYMWVRGGGGHRIVVGYDYDPMIIVEEFAHMLDKELGKKAEFSRSRRWQDVMRKERSNFSVLYTSGKATEDFAHTFLLYVLHKERLDKYPLRLSIMQELFG